MVEKVVEVGGASGAPKIAWRVLNAFITTKRIGPSASAL
jgi:hypothetical protein